MSPALAGELFTTEPPGKPRRGLLCYCSSVLRSGCRLLSRWSLRRPAGRWHSAKPVQAKHKPSRFFFNLKKFSRHILPVGDSVTRISFFPFCHGNPAGGQGKRQVETAALAKHRRRKSREDATKAWNRQWGVRSRRYKDKWVFGTLGSMQQNQWMWLEANWVPRHQSRTEPATAWLCGFLKPLDFRGLHFPPCNETAGPNLLFSLQLENLIQGLGIDGE